MYILIVIISKWNYHGSFLNGLGQVEAGLYWVRERGLWTTELPGSMVSQQARDLPLLRHYFAPRSPGACPRPPPLDTIKYPATISAASIVQPNSLREGRTATTSGSDFIKYFFLIK